MDWAVGKGLEQQLGSLGLDDDFGLGSGGGTGTRESKFSVFGNSSAAADVEANAGGPESTDVKNFPPLLKFFYVGELSALRPESVQSVLKRSRLLLILTSAMLLLNFITNIYVTALGAYLGWLGLVLSPILGVGFVLLACWAYAMTYRGARFSSANVMRNGSYMDLALIVISLLYALLPVINFNGWFRYLVNNHDKNVAYFILVGIEALMWTIISVTRVFVLISLNQVIEITSGETDVTFTARTSNAARAESLAQIRNAYRGNTNHSSSQH